MYDEFYQEGTLDSLAYFFFLKRIYQKSLFYNFSWSSLAEKSGVSVNTLKRHVGRLMDKNLVSIHGDNIHIHSPKLGDKMVLRSYVSKNGSRQEYGYKEVLKKDEYLLIPASLSNDIKEIKILLRSVPVFCSIARQCSKLEVDNQNAVRRVSGIKKQCSSFSTYVTLSNKTICQKINRKSVSTAQRYKNTLRSMNIMDWRYQYMTAEDYGKIFGDPFEVAPKGALKMVDGKLSVQLSNNYRLKYFSENFVKKSSTDSRAINAFCKGRAQVVSSW